MIFVGLSIGNRTHEPVFFMQARSVVSCEVLHQLTSRRMNSVESVLHSELFQHDQVTALHSIRISSLLILPIY